MKKIIILCLLCIAAVLLALAVWLIFSNQNPAGSVEVNLTAENFHSAYFMQEEFYTGILNPESVKPMPQRVYGGIVSHHFFVERHIAKLFASWSKQDYKTIVLIGPNHFNAGKAEIIISRQGYKTPWGALEPDSEIINQLLQTGLVRNEEDPFAREHSISVEVGFIKHQFPNAKIVPIIIRHSASKEKMQQLAEALNNLLIDDALVLASVDFSHHVDNKTAQEQDKQSINFLEKFDSDSIFRLPPIQMDSPATIYALLKYLEIKGAKHMQYSNTNAALVSGNLESKDVTSYVFASFFK